MAEHILYPTELPTHCITRLIDIARSNAWTERFPEVLKSVYTIIGYAVGKFIGDPDGEVIVGSGLDKENIARDARAFLDEVQAGASEQLMSGPITDAIIAQLLAAIIEYILEHLDDWLADNAPSENKRLVRAITRCAGKSMGIKGSAQMKGTGGA